MESGPQPIHWGAILGYFEGPVAKIRDAGHGNEGGGDHGGRGGEEGGGEHQGGSGAEEGEESKAQYSRTDSFDPGSSRRWKCPEFSAKRDSVKYLPRE